MNCGIKEEYTLYDHEGDYGYRKGNHDGQYFKTRVVELTQCEARFFEGINSECKEVRLSTAKHISKLINE